MFSTRLRRAAAIAFACSALAGPASALTIEFTTSASEIQTYFDGTSYEMYSGFTGSGVTFQPPDAGPFMFDFLTTSVDLTPGVVVDFVDVNWLGNRVSDSAAPGVTDSGPISYTLTVNSPLISGPNTATGTWIENIQWVNNGQFMMTHVAAGANTATFDLGAEGLLEVTLMTLEFASQGSPGSGASARTFFAQFLLREADEEPMPAPEPAGLLLFGAGLAGLAGLRRRAPSK